MVVLETNSELVRKAFALFESGDINALLDLYHPDVVMHASGALVEKRVYRGRQELGRALKELHAAGQNRSIEDFEAHEAGELVVATAMVSGPGKREAAWLLSVVDGRIRLIEGFLSAADAWGRVAQAGEHAAWGEVEAAETARGLIVARLIDQDRVVLRLDDGRRLEAPLPAHLASRWLVGSGVTAYFDEAGNLLGWSADA